VSESILRISRAIILTQRASWLDTPETWCVPWATKPAWLY